MAKHEVVIHENKGATKDVAPYTGSYVAKETEKLAAFVGEIAKQCGLPAIQVEAILTGSFEIFEELERSGLVRIHTDIGTVCGIITGSFPTSDAAFNPEKNTLELALRLDDEIRNALADVVPYIAQDDSLTKLRVDNVMDLETPRPMNLIHGQGVFRVAGFNMVLTDEDATAYLTNALGVTFPLVIDEIITKQLFKAHTAALLEPGDYKLVVKSRAGDAEGPLQTAFRKVKYLKVTPPGPEITKVTSGSGDDADVIYRGEPVVVHGERFAATQDDTVTIARGDTDTWEWTGNDLTVIDPAGKLSLNYMSCKHNGEAGTFYVGEDPCELVVSFKGATRTVQYAGTRG